MASIKQVIAHRLRVLRAERQMSQEELSKASGVAISSIGAYERAEAVPLLETACKLVDALGCTPNDLCDFPVNDNK